MKLLPDWLLSALGDGQGNVSMSRLIAFITVVSCVVMPATAMFWLSCLGGAMVKVPDGLTIFMGSASGLSLAMFAFNKRGEA